MKRIIRLSIVWFILIIGLACEKEAAPITPPKSNTPVSAYLDIETTGLKISDNDITVIGIYLERIPNPEFIQLVDSQITADRLQEILKNINTLYTYNGVRFDLPFIKKKLNFDINQYCKHIDLMNICHEKKLYGGLKKVEQKLGISRESDIDGREAIKLRNEYKKKGNQESLNTLLKYNKEDVINLSILRQKLEGYKYRG